ncbi:MAG: hypothetical protein U0610_01030 [bacterium]
METFAIAAAALLGAGCALFVVWPFLRRDPAAASANAAENLAEELAEEKSKLLAALKEIEFDHHTGKLSDEDFRKLDGEYRSRALEVLRRIDEFGPVASDDVLAAVEADVRRALGGRPDAAPRACAGCGERLAGGVRFCTSCGRPVAVAAA